MPGSRRRRISRSMANTSIRPSSTVARVSSEFPSSTAMSRKPRSTISIATRVRRLGAGPRLKAGSKNDEMVGGLDYMATFAALAGVKLPENDREGKPIIFDSFDLTPLLFGTGKSPRNDWFDFTENELTPGAA